MTVFVKYLNLYLPTEWEVSKYPVLLPFPAEAMLYDMTLFTVEQKKLRNRHKISYVYIYNCGHLSCNEDYTPNDLSSWTAEN